jgi:hypothetical protein
VRTPDERTLKVPVWMTQENAALHETLAVVAIDSRALLNLSAFIESHFEKEHG